MPKLRLSILSLVAASFCLSLDTPPASAAPQHIEARSSRQHDDGSFRPLDLPLAGPRSVESRLLRNGRALVLLIFDNDLTSIGSIESSHGEVQSFSGIRGAFPNSIEVAVDNLPDDGYYLTITVNDVTDASGTLPQASATVGMLIGDVDGTRSVNVTDIRRTASRSGQQVSSNNFWHDLDLTGSINVTDIRRAASRSGRALPAAPPTFIGSPEDQQTTPGVVTPAQTVTLDDFDTDAGSLTLTAVSSNTTLLPNAGITLAGSGASRTVALQPAVGQTGTATVTLTVSDGSLSATTTFVLTANDNAPPQAIASAGNFLGRAPLATTFDARRSNDPNGNITSYTWDFGDGTSGTGVAPSHTYNTPGTYNATLTVTDNGGLTDSLTHVITVDDSTFDVDDAPTPNEARRFLWQAAFGPTDGEIQDVVNQGYEGWMDSQIARSPSLLTLAQLENIADFRNNGSLFVATRIAWSNLAVESPDQLRHRIAWALIQLIVLNDNQDNSGPRASIRYYNLYLNHAFGNYLDLLRDVTFTHNMGNYLTYIGNEKASGGLVPDENYAREIMQLFSIGLYELNMDGSFKRDAQGQLIPTYDNETIQQFARVFTGLAIANFGGNTQARQALPMRMISSRHEFGAKQLLDYPGAVNNGFIPARPGSSQNNANGIADINFAVDNVFNHPNTPPFVSKQLIQRLVTSNPTPAYVERVANVFANNGSGVRGDLAAVTKAILLDPEARDTTYSANPLMGKLVEPLLLKHAIYRVMNRSDNPNSFGLRVTEQGFRDLAEYAQGFMAAPSVFNFYLPDYTVPGSGLDERVAVGPELQIADEIIVLSSLESYRSQQIAQFGPDRPLVYDQWQPIAGNISNLIDAADERLMYGRMSPEMRAILTQALSAYGNNEVTERVRVITWLIIGSPEFLLMD